MTPKDFPENPTFAELKHFARSRLVKAREFVLAVERFGHVPGESWAELAAHLTRSIEDLATIAKIFDAKPSLPRAERQALAAEIRPVTDQIGEFTKKIRYQIQTNAPPKSVTVAPNPVAQKIWADYDDIVTRSGLTMYNRRLVQGLLNRAHEPTGLVDLLFDDEISGREIWDLRSAFIDLVRHTPLDKLSGQTLAGRESEFRRSLIDGTRSGAKSPNLPLPFDKLVALLEGSAQDKKQAHRLLEQIYKGHHDEVWGRVPSTDWPHYRQLLAIWDGAKAALDHSDPVYRRGALAVLPKLGFSRVLDDVFDEVLPFIVKGLQDPHGHIRFKIVRFVDTLYPLYFDERQAELDAFEQSVRDSRRQFRRGSPERKSHDQVLRFISWMKEHRAYLAMTKPVGEGSGQ